jgi:hypothetical protein
MMDYVHSEFRSYGFKGRRDTWRDEANRGEREIQNEDRGFPASPVQSGSESTVACMADNDARVDILRKFPRKERSFSDSARVQSRFSH